MNKDIERALFYERLAEDCYFGKGVKKNPDAAKTYFCLAALYGEGELKTDALCNLALLTEDPQAKLALYMQAAEENCAHAMNMIGVYFEHHQKDLPEDLPSARKWYLEAAGAGSPDGMYNFARLTETHREKIKYLERAAEFRHAPSIKMLEELREELRREEEARKAKEQGSMSFCLGAARKWAGKPVAILSLATDLSSRNRNQFVYDVAMALKQSVLFLFSGETSIGALHCVGYDYGKVGLAEAMNNPYSVGKCWGLGKFVIGSVDRNNKDSYCAAVELALTDPAQ